MKIYGLAIVIPLAYLSISAYRFLQEKRSTAPRIYDVFLSFRGSDTRTGFTDFLYKSLIAAGVHVFRDDKELPFGEEIGTELLQAIRTCRIAIPIISVQYAQSEWCLRELTEMLHCHREHGKSVFPLFYKVDVVDVGRQRGRFEEALSERESQSSLQEVQEWREALTFVAKIRGWTSETIADGHEAELVEMVRDKVLCELKSMWIEQLPVFIGSVCSYFSKKSKWQVFLAFHGDDVKNSLAAYLYFSLQNAGIRVFSHDHPSLIGKDVADEIWNAIDCCKISIPILSKSFASSSWCLEELAKMVKYKRMKRQKILPIFYKVRPRHMREISHDFEKDMLRHKELDDSTAYEQWEQALREIGSSKGLESERIANGNEGELVRRVVEQVLMLLNNP